ncbi:hypothetical protein, partial [Sporolactobacillus inulinus]
KRRFSTEKTGRFCPVFLIALFHHMTQMLMLTGSRSALQRCIGPAWSLSKDTSATQFSCEVLL